MPCHKVRILVDSNNPISACWALYDATTMSSTPSSRPLLDLLIATRRREVSDKRDKIFALLSVPQRQHPAIDVDDSASLEGVCQRYILVQSEKDLSIL